MKILLDYLFPITAIEPTPAASTAFLKQVCVVAKPKSGQEGNVGQVFLCTSSEAVGVRTDNEDADQLFAAGMSKVYVLLSNDLDIADALDANQNLFYTVLISSDFDDADFDDDGDEAESATAVVGDLTFTALPGEDGNDFDVILAEAIAGAGEEVVHVSGDTITVLMKSTDSTAAQIKAAWDDSIAVANLGITCAIAPGQDAIAQGAATSTDFTGGVDATGAGLLLGTFVGVTGMSSADTTLLTAQAAIERRCAFFKKEANDNASLFYAFGKLLSNALDWKNQQYVTMPVDDEVASLGDAESLFDSRISFVISDDEFSTRLAFFACGGKAIVQPYIVRNLQIDMQSEALSYIAGNEPAYTKTQAALLEDELQKVIDGYIEVSWIEAGVVEVSLEEDNFVAAGNINIAEPKALWRIFGEMRQTL